MFEIFLFIFTIISLFFFATFSPDEELRSEPDISIMHPKPNIPVIDKPVLPTSQVSGNYIDKPVLLKPNIPVINKLVLPKPNIPVINKPVLPKPNNLINKPILPKPEQTDEIIPKPILRIGKSEKSEKKKVSFSDTRISKVGGRVRVEKAFNRKTKGL